MSAGISASDWFAYRNGELCCDKVPVRVLAENLPTPCYVYAGAAIDEAVDAIDKALSFAPHLLAYAVKANGNLALLSRLAALGCGADIVSEGELHRALRAGMPKERIRFTGVGKTRQEIAAAIDADIAALHVESVQELEVVASIARERGVRARVGIRVNPDVDPKTHPYIATGLRQSKFGVPIETARGLIEGLLANDALELTTIASHIGSQLSATGSLEEAVGIVGAFVVECLDRGASITAIDVGGGWAMNYGDEDTPYPSHAAFGEAVRAGLHHAGALDRGLTVVTEPGRALVGDAGGLLTRVLYTKQQGDKHFAIVDAAMTELIRPALYQAYHAVVPVAEPVGDAPLQEYDVVGPVCESGDFLAKDRPLPVLQQGDLVLVRGAGAYCREMASTYNGRRLAPEVLVDGNQHRVIRRPLGFETLWLGETPD